MGIVTSRKASNNPTVPQSAPVLHYKESPAIGVGVVSIDHGLWDNSLTALPGSPNSQQFVSRFEVRGLEPVCHSCLSLRGPMSNINGKVYALNAITPMKPWKTWILRAVFFALGHVKPLQNDLINLSFIEFARWVIVPRRGFPCLGKGQLPEELKYDYLLFFSNFNGTWNQYIDAFSAVLSKGLNLVWRWSEKFPGSVPVTLFKEYIARVQFDTDYYYTAYPHASANDLKSAHIVQSSFDSLSAIATQSSPEEFAAAYLQFVLQVQAHLGETGEAPAVG